MAKRAADTYRSARREAWKALPRADRPSWPEYNQSPIGRRPGKGRGKGKPHPAVAELGRHHLQMIGGFRVRRNQPARGKNYGNFGGTREIARHAGRPDGAMHGPLPIHERNAQAALFDMPKARKPRRAP